MALQERDRAVAERDQALKERDQATAERNAAVREHERAFAQRLGPPRTWAGSARASWWVVWTPRLIALGILAVLVVVIALLFHLP
jgi:hypothetical protein